MVTAHPAPATATATRTAAGATARACVDCTGDLAHCHGSLLVHPDGGCECTEAGCHLGPAHHVLFLPCAEAACGCPGGEAGERAA